MKPLKTTIPLSRWMLRICLTAFVFFTYFNTFMTMSFKSLGFYFAAIYIVFGALLMIGGFLPKHSLTVFSGLVIFILSVYQLIKSFTGEINEYLLVYLLPASIAFFFLSTGNND